jgi:hypothetical protein
VTGDNIGGILKAISHGQIETIDRVAPELPEDLRALIDRMLARERHHRPDLAEAMHVLSGYSDTRVPEFGAPAARPSQQGWQSWWQPAAPVELVAPIDDGTPPTPAGKDRAVVSSPGAADPDASTQIESVLPSETPPDAVDAPPAHRRRRTWIGALAASAVAVVLGIVWIGWRSDTPAGAPDGAPGARAASVAPAQSAAGSTVVAPPSEPSDAPSAAVSAPTDPPRRASPAMRPTIASASAVPTSSTAPPPPPPEGIVEKAPY